MGRRKGGRRHPNTFLPAHFNVVSPERVAGGAPHRKERLFCTTPKPPDRHVAYYNIATRGAHIGKVCIAAAGGRRWLRRRRNVIFCKHRSRFLYWFRGLPSPPFLRRSVSINTRHDFVPSRNEAPVLLDDRDLYCGGISRRLLRLPVHRVRSQGPPCPLTRARRA